MFRSLSTGFAWAMILGALTIVVVGFALVPFIGVAVMSALAAAESPFDASQVPPAPAQVPKPAPSAPPASQGAPTSPSGITQGIWRWERSEYSDDSTIVAMDPSKYTISFQADGRLAIRADCNQGSASYTLEGARLTITPGVMTAAACVPASQDSVFLRDLREVATYVMDGDTLVLNLKVDSGNMVFSPQPPLSLTGGPWRIQSYNNGSGGVVSVLPDAQLTATFGDDGSVSGNAGCNGYRGSYTLAGNRITFGPIASTKRACLSEPLNQQETRFLTALGASTTYELVGDRLTFRNDAGATQVLLVRPSVQPVPSPAPANP